MVIKAASLDNVELGTKAPQIDGGIPTEGGNGPGGKGGGDHPCMQSIEPSIFENVGWSAGDINEDTAADFVQAAIDTSIAVGGDIDLLETAYCVEATYGLDLTETRIK